MLRRFHALLFALIAISLVPAHAFAQAVAPAAPTPQPMSVMLALIAIQSASAFLRGIAPGQSWAHTKWGSVALTALGAVLGTLYSTIQVHGLDVHAIEFALAGAAAGLLGAFNPSLLSGALQKSPELAAKTGAAVLLIFAISGCAHFQPLPAPTAAAYKQAFENCLSNEGWKEAAPEVAKIWQILDAGGSSAQAIEQNVETASLTLGGDAAVVCIDCAVLAWDESNPVLPNVAPTKNQAAVRLYKAKWRSHAAIEHARTTAIRAKAVGQ